ncbi:(Fe-S)-binding protein [Flavobacterium subsaxonicum]|uniref:Fe-S oxidoreductase n=1 Tax=Flavobacterium subsaxonicum WB 4.1-42 = DSM 21790 TaxID=1121898 RepID=A0A0A2MQ68_9FLAO|nr:(Fe-S)-binding protein [Flavobacterium subsaxonicum]KGO93603.1 Fe-S oxidoreductase [Flavobacterium subsaxonicum WB 4.1-42 = DSM 21790]
MKVGLFIPCYIDQLYPKVAVATLELLERLGLDVYYPTRQTCCGQPLANSGYSHLTYDIDELFTHNFESCDYVVSPSGSCTLHIKEHLHNYKNIGSAQHIKKHIYELVEFLTDVIKVENLKATFPYRVGLHQSCHGQRGLRLASMTERVEVSFSKPKHLLSMVNGLKLIDLTREDECCGFGGTFCVTEEAVSVRMGQDRVADHLNHKAQYITAADMSCLMHMQGILKRQNSNVQVIHIAEILNATL